MWAVATDVMASFVYLFVAMNHANVADLIDSRLTVGIVGRGTFGGTCTQHPFGNGCFILVIIIIVIDIALITVMLNI